MRKKYLEQLEDDIAEVSSPDEMTALAREMMIKRFGGQCASWLVWKHKRMIHRNGGIDFVIPKDATSPPWFVYGIEFLKRRKGWSVVVRTDSQRRRYRVRWYGSEKIPVTPQEHSFVNFPFTQSTRNLESRPN